MLANWVKETTATTGAGTINLGGAVAGFIAFSAAFPSGATVLYSIEDGGNRETGLGILTSGSPWTLARTTVFETLVSGTYNGAPSSGINLSGSAVVSINDAVQGFGPNSLTYPSPSLANAVLRPPGVLTYGNDGKGGGEFTATAGRIVCMPFTAYTPLKMTAIGASISTLSAGGLFRVGLYTRTYDNKVGNLIVDSGNLSTSATGQVFATLGSTLYLPAGRYFAADCVDNTTATAKGQRGAAGAQADNWYGITTDLTVADQKPYKNQSYGAMPSSFGTPDGHINWASFGLLWK